MVVEAVGRFGGIDECINICPVGLGGDRRYHRSELNEFDQE